MARPPPISASLLHVAVAPHLVRARGFLGHFGPDHTEFLLDGTATPRPQPDRPIARPPPCSSRRQPVARPPANPAASRPSTASPLARRPPARPQPARTRPAARPADRRPASRRLPHARPLALRPRPPADRAPTAADRGVSAEDSSEVCGWPGERRGGALTGAIRDGVCVGNARPGVVTWRWAHPELACTRRPPRRPWNLASASSATVRVYSITWRLGVSGGLIVKAPCRRPQTLMDMDALCGGCNS